MQHILAAATPYLIELLATFITAIVALAATRFASTQSAIKTKTGLDIEAILRSALHQALTTGAQNAAAGGMTGQTAIEATIAHAKASVPDAIAKLAPSPPVLVNLAKAKLTQVLGLK